MIIWVRVRTKRLDPCQDNTYVHERRIRTQVANSRACLSVGAPLLRHLIWVGIRHTRVGVVTACRPDCARPCLPDSGHRRSSLPPRSRFGEGVRSEWDPVPTLKAHGCERIDGSGVSSRDVIRAPAGSSNQKDWGVVSGIEGPPPPPRSCAILAVQAARDQGLFAIERQDRPHTARFGRPRGLQSAQGCLLVWTAGIGPASR
jgi:hypothetical protein